MCETYIYMQFQEAVCGLESLTGVFGCQNEEDGDATLAVGTICLPHHSVDKTSPLSLAPLLAHSSLLRRRRWCWHRAKEQLIEISPKGQSIVCVEARGKSLGYAFKEWKHQQQGKQEFRLS